MAATRARTLSSIPRLPRSWVRVVPAAGAGVVGRPTGKATTNPGGTHGGSLVSSPGLWGNGIGALGPTGTGDGLGAASMVSL